MPGTKPSGAIRLTCPHCRATTEKSLLWLKRHDALPCPSCNKPIKVRRFRAQAGAEALFEELTGFASDGKDPRSGRS